MNSLRQALSQYGTLAALLLMCGILSMLTLKEQHPNDASAAQALARRLGSELKPGARVLVVGRNNQEDERFTSELQSALTAVALDVTRVTGTPQDARRALQDLVDRQLPLAAIAGNKITTDWLVFQDLTEKFPPLQDCRIVRPASYTWPTFLKTDNLLNVANQISVIAIIAIGMTFVIIAGGIDLSVGSLIALSSVIAGLLIRRWGGTAAAPGSMISASLIAVGVCGLVGVFSGAMVIAMDIPPFIVTLAMMLVASGVAFLLSGGNAIPELPESYTWLARKASAFGIPNAVVLMVLLYVAASAMLTRTVLGRHIYAVGGNRQAAWLSGIPHKRVLLFTYIASGLLAGVGGILIASDYQSGDPRYGETYELYVIAAVVVGGTSLAGGRGTIVGTLIGALIIGVIANGMNLLLVNSYAQKVIVGLVILTAVMLDQLKRNVALSDP